MFIFYWKIGNKFFSLGVTERNINTISELTEEEINKYFVQDINFEIVENFSEILKKSKLINKFKTRNSHISSFFVNIFANFFSWTNAIKSRYLKIYCQNYEVQFWKMVYICELLAQMWIKREYIRFNLVEYFSTKPILWL